MSQFLDPSQGSQQLQDAAKILRSPRDTTGLCLLSLDGGGVRGLSTLLIMRYLMNMVNEGRPKSHRRKPYQIFDMIGGTSTGGLIAIMLGRLKMDVEECIEVYNNLFKDIFGKQVHRSPISFTGKLKSKFDSDILRQSVAEIVGKYGLSEEYADKTESQRSQLAKALKLADGTSRGCRTFVCATSYETKETVLFRDYNLVDHEEESASIIDAACATSAATTFFDVATVGRRKYRDGAFGANNPVDEVYIEAGNVWDKEGGQMSSLLKCFISIGTGNPGLEPMKESVWGFLTETLADLVTETERTGEKFMRRHKDIAAPDGTQRFFRFNVEQGLQKIGLEEYLRQGEIEAATKRYMESLQQRTIVKMCAENLKLKEFKAPLCIKEEVQIHNYEQQESQYHSHQRLRQPKNLTDIEAALLQTLGPSNYIEHKTRNPDRVDGTCQWFLKNPKFTDWNSSRTSRLLWVSADPGCGKSVLSKSLLDNELLSTESRTTCYFFFKDDNVDQKTATKAVCGLLHQLFCQRMHLLKYAMKEFEKNGKSLSLLFNTLWTILLDASSDSEAGEVICLLDALDECEESGRYSLIKSLDRLYQTAIPDAKNRTLKFLVTSRPYFDIERRFKKLTTNFPTIRLAGEEETDSISQEIDLVIKKRVHEISMDLGLEDSVRLSLEKDLLKGTNRTYLWLKLIFELIYRRLDVTEKRLLETIGTIPDTVDKAYETILGRAADTKRAQKLLHIVVSAVRPLNLHEINVALAIEESNRSEKDLDLEPEATFQKTIRNLCGLFVNVVDSKIYLIHQTAKEFLVSKQHKVQRVTSPGTWKHSLEPADSNSVLAKACIWYLSFDTFDTDPQKLGDVNKYIREHHMLEYAAIHWPIHCREARIEMSSASFELLLDLCHTPSNRFKTWYMVYMKRQKNTAYPDNPTDLMIASYFGLKLFIEHLLEVDANAKANINTADNIGRTPLIWAAREGHAGVAEVLLDKCADVNTKDLAGDTPLLKAVMRGYVPIVELLLGRGANPNSRGLDGRTAISCAISMRHEAIVKLLLDNGVNVNLTDNESDRTPLMIAAANGDESLVKLLLKEEVGVDSKDNYNNTPLSFAAHFGRTGVVKLLVEKDVDLNSKNNLGDTPLLQAVARGHKAVVKLLLEKNAKVDLEHNNGYNALYRAMEGDHESVVRLLLEKNIDVDFHDKRYQTLMQFATQKRQRAIVELLLEKKVEVDARDANGRTTLSWAAEKGDELIAKLLLAKGAQVDPKDNRGMTPLLWAVDRGHRAVKLLLDHGASLESVDNAYGRTPLLWAAERGSEEVVKLLLRYGAAVDAKGFDERTPLFWAVLIRNEGVVRLLLMNRANVSFKDKHGQTPLFCAVESGHKAIIKLLLENDPQANLKDNARWTLLPLVVDRGDKAMAMLLLGDSFNAKFVDMKYAWKLLSWAAEDGNEEMVTLLIEKNAEKIDSSLLSWSAKSGYELVVKQLLQKQAAVDLKDTNGRTPLSWAAENGHLAVAKLLLEKKATVDLKDTSGWTPVLWAAARGCTEVLKLLLENGANADLKHDISGKTPLLLAASNGHPGTVELLLREGVGVQVDPTDSYGRTPLSWAAYFGHEAVVRLLLESGARINCKDGKYSRTPLSWAAQRGHEAVVEVLLRYGAEVDSIDSEYGQTPLSRAVESGNEVVAELLIKNGAEVDAMDNKFGQTPLSRAAESGNDAVVKLLLENGAEVDSTDNQHCWTPLFWAIGKGHEEVAKLMLEKSATIDLMDQSGQTPLSIAAERGQENMVKLLLESNATVGLADFEDRPPLWWALSGGHMGVVKLLREHATSKEL